MRTPRWGMTLSIGVLLTLTACASGGSPPGLLALSSPTFSNGGAIPARHSAYGEEVSPPLNWTNVPDSTRSFALIVEDLDAGSRPFAHWVVYNIPGTVTGLPEGLPPTAVLTAPPELAGTTFGFNGRRTTDYYGPEPPREDEPHRYRFRLYALSVEPDLEDSLNAAALRQVIEEAILDQSDLTGTFDAPAQ